MKTFLRKEVPKHSPCIKFLIWWKIISKRTGSDDHIESLLPTGIKTNEFYFEHSQTRTAKQFPDAIVKLLSMKNVFLSFKWNLPSCGWNLMFHALPCGKAQWRNASFFPNQISMMQAKSAPEPRAAVLLQPVSYIISWCKFSILVEEYKSLFKQKDQN